MSVIVKKSIPRMKTDMMRNINNHFESHGLTVFTGKTYVERRLIKNQGKLRRLFGQKTEFIMVGKLEEIFAHLNDIVFASYEHSFTTLVNELGEKHPEYNIIIIEEFED